MLGISIGILIICVLLIWSIIAVRGLWWIKAAFIFISCWYCISLYNSLDDFKGWPTTEPLPEKFQIHWIVVDVPNIHLKIPGAIYMMVQDIEPDFNQEIDMMKLYYPDLYQPRLYKLPYNQNDHKQAQQIKKRLMDGEKVMGQRKKGNGESGKGKGQGQGEGFGKDGLGDKKGHGGEGYGAFEQFEFQKLPPPKLPGKD